MTTADQFREHALSLPGAEEGEHMGHADFRANGRVFASLDADEAIGTAMLTPQQQRKMTQASPAFAAAKGAWGKRGCTTIALNDAKGDMVRAALTMAWENAMAQAPGRPRKVASGEAKAPAKKASAKKEPTKKAPTKLAPRKVVGRSSRRGSAG
jgi:hypothetical protein